MLIKNFSFQIFNEILEFVKNFSSYQGVKVEQIGPNYEEDLDRSEYTNHGDFVADLAYYKVDDVYQRLKNDKNQSDSRKKLIIGADTLVTLNDTIYGKPKDEAEAIKTITE